jgi:RNA polymerase sigma-70 factor (ECF subfamily)
VHGPGDEQAFAVLYRRHSPAVFRYAWLLTGSESAAADAVQEAFIGLLEASR